MGDICELPLPHALPSSPFGADWVGGDLILPPQVGLDQLKSSIVVTGLGSP